jgi:hypothetical protein
MQWSTFEDIEVSSHPVQSGNQVDSELDLLTAAGSSSFGQASEATWDPDLSSPEHVRPSFPTLSSSDKPLIRKNIRKSGKNPRQHALKTSAPPHDTRNGNGKTQTQRPRAPHNTSQYIMTEKAQSPAAPEPEEACTSALPFPSGSMIGIVNWTDLERAEQDLQRGSESATSGKTSTEREIPCTNPNNSLDRQERWGQSDVMISEDIVSVLLREIKVRDRLIEQLTNPHPPPPSPSSLT